MTRRKRASDPGERAALLAGLSDLEDEPTAPSPPVISSRSLAPDPESVALEHKLQVVARMAPALRQAGVLHLDVDGVVMQLVPGGALATDARPKDAPPPASSDPLEDETTFAGGRVPRLDRLDNPDDED